MKEDNKIIIEQSREQIEKDLYPYERRCWLLNLFLERMDQTGFPLTEVSQIANTVATGAERYIRHRILSGASLEMVGGIKLNRELMIDAIEIPDITEVVSVEKLLKQYFNIPFSALAFHDGKFTVSEDVKHKIIQQHTRYAETDRQAEAFHDAKKLVSEINKFHKRYGPAKGNRQWHHLTEIQNMWKWKDETVGYEVNTALILSGHLEKQ